MQDLQNNTNTDITTPASVFNNIPRVYECKYHSRFGVSSIDLGDCVDFITHITPIKFKRKIVYRNTFNEKTGVDVESVIEYQPQTFKVCFKSVIGPSVEQKLMDLMKNKAEGISMVINEYDACDNVVQKWTLTFVTILEVDFGYLDVNDSEHKTVEVVFNPEFVHLEF